MKSLVAENIQRHLKAVESLLINNIIGIEKFCVLARDCLASGGKLVFAGNGGSAADSQHLAAEFVGRYKKNRAPLSALALTTDTSALTAIANDYGFEEVFRRQVSALCNGQDMLVLISTTGGSRNLIKAAAEARSKNIFTVGLLGRDGGELSSNVDLAIIVAAEETARIQECHILIGHIICDACDENVNSIN